MMPVIVTGGAGYIGSHVCKYLHGQGYLPITIDNLSRGHKDAVKWGPLEQGDIRDKYFLRAMFRKYKPAAVMHIAGLAYVGESVKQPAEYYDNNVTGTLVLLDEMREALVNNLVFSSSCAVYGDVWQNEINELCDQHPTSPYGKSKWMCEKIIRDYVAAYGMRAVPLRYFNAAGADLDGEIGECHEPETHLIPLVLDAACSGNTIIINGNDYNTSDGTCVRDYVHVTDLAQAHYLAMNRLLSRERFFLADGKKVPGEGHDFNLGNGTGFSILEIIHATEELVGKKIDFQFGPRREGDAASAVCFNGKARDILGWNPKHSDLRTILETAWKWRNRK